eukprot:scaffold489_cov309-Pavlova_lutheri.AAC.6
MKHTIGLTVEPRRPKAKDKSGTTTAVRNANTKSTTVTVTWASVPKGEQLQAPAHCVHKQRHRQSDRRAYPEASQQIARGMLEVVQ